MHVGNILIPVGIFIIIAIAVLWMFGRCKFKMLRRRQRSSDITLTSGFRLRIFSMTLFCCWSRRDLYAVLLKYSENIRLLDYSENQEKLKSIECVICQDVFDKLQTIVSFTCGHCFHTECIVQWLYERKRCPLCWSDITGKIDKVDNV